MLRIILENNSKIVHRKNRYGWMPMFFVTCHVLKLYLIRDSKNDCIMYKVLVQINCYK